MAGLLLPRLLFQLHPALDDLLKAGFCVRQLLQCLRNLLRRSEEHTSELQSRPHLVCRLLLEKKHAIVFAVISLRTTTTIASVLTLMPTTADAFCNAVRTSFAGSMMPCSTMSTDSSVFACIAK